MVELLIAIIVLGVLSAVVVFAVGGLRGGATEASCTAGHDAQLAAMPLS